MMEWLGLTETAHFLVYFVLVLGIVVLPGMDMAFVMASALVGGKRSGLAAVAGITAAGMVHTLMGAIGVGVVIKTMPQLFNAMLWAGSAYIAWIGWSLLRGASALGDVPDGQDRSLVSTFGRAAATCLLNPKAYVFMLAVFPQFLQERYGPMIPQAIVLGFLTSLSQILVYGAIALGASGIRQRLRSNQRGQVLMGQVVGAALLLTSIWTAWQGWRLA